MGKRAVHYRSPGATLPIARGAQGPRTACGKKLTRARGMGRVWLSDVKSSPDPDDATCAACRRWLAMSVEARAAIATAKQDKARAAHAALKTRREAARDRERAALVDHVEAARPSAVVAIDAVLADRVGAGDPAVDHMLGEAMSAALAAYRLANPKTRGGRRWVFETGWMRYFPGARSAGGSNTRVVACRYCRAPLGVGHIGEDYSASCFDERGDLVRYPVDRSHIAISVARHTTLCALAYLAGVPNPEPIVMITQDKAEG